MPAKHNLVKWSVISCLLLTCISAFAKKDEHPLQTNRYVFGLDLGTSLIRNLGNATSFPLGYSTFSYTPNQHREQPLRFGASLRKTINFLSLDAVQVGISYHHITKMSVHGALEQGMFPPFSQFNYSYSMTSSQLLAEAKLLRQWYKIFYPYLIGGIGVGFNKAMNYATTVPDYLTLTPWYSNNARISLSYSVGLGIDLLKSQSLSIGLGYRFSDLGQVRLGDGRIRSRETPSSPGQSHLYQNTVLIELSCFV